MSTLGYFELQAARVPELEAKLDKMRADLKLALVEIEQRGNRIGALESMARGLLDIVEPVALPVEDRKKAIKLKSEAIRMGVI